MATDRSFDDFLVRTTVIHKVVERRLGTEGPLSINPWNWDSRYVTYADYSPDTLPNPGLNKKMLKGLPRAYWQNGPTSIDAGEPLKLIDIKRVFARGIHRWVPTLKPGLFNIWRDTGYLYSDNSIVEYVSSSHIESNGYSYHEVEREVAPEAPIRATVFSRDINGEYLPWREYNARMAFTGVYIDGVEQSTRSGDNINWSVVDTHKKEFVLLVTGNGYFLQFSRNVVELIGSDSAAVDLNDLFDYEFIGVSTGQPNQIFPTGKFPICSDATIRVYSVDENSGTPQSYSVVSSFTGSNQVMIDHDLGFVYFGNSTSGSIPTLGHRIYISYYVTPRIEYEETNKPRQITSITADVNPLVNSINRGFITLRRSQPDVARINLEVLGIPLQGNSYGPISLGTGTVNLKATAFSLSNDIVPSEVVRFHLESTPYFGTLGGIGKEVDRLTNIRGEARSFYTAPASIDSLGYYVTTLSDTNEITLPVDANYVNAYDVYTFQVLKDDPIFGKAGADTTLGEIEWEEGLLNGRKCILYEWNAAAIHPITGLTGAYTPVRPTISGGNILTYTSLTAPDPTSGVSNMIGAYFVVSDRTMTIRASAYSRRLGMRVYSAPVNIKVSLPQYMKGSYVVGTLETPFGWRLPDDLSTTSSGLNGANFISINPVAGPYPIVNILDGETWITGTPTEVTNAPFSGLHLTCNI